MRNIKLKFAKNEYVLALLADNTFMNDTASHLNPVLVDNHHILFSDPVEGHDEIDTEDVALRICGEALKRILFNGNCYFGYLNSNALEMKRGIVFEIPNQTAAIPIVLKTSICK